MALIDNLKNFVVVAARMCFKISRTETQQRRLMITRRMMTRKQKFIRWIVFVFVVVVIHLERERNF